MLVLPRFDCRVRGIGCTSVPSLSAFFHSSTVLARAQPPSSSNAVSVSTPGSASAGLWTDLLTLPVLSKIGFIPHNLSMLLIKRHAPMPSSLGRSEPVTNKTVSQNECSTKTQTQVSMPSPKTPVARVPLCPDQCTGTIEPSRAHIRHSGSVVEYSGPSEYKISGHIPFGPRNNGWHV